VKKYIQRFVFLSEFQYNGSKQGRFLLRNCPKPRREKILIDAAKTNSLFLRLKRELNSLLVSQVIDITSKNFTSEPLLDSSAIFILIEVS